MKAYLKSVLLISTISIFLLGCEGDLAGFASANAGPDQTQVEATTITLSGSTDSIRTSIDYKWVEGATVLSTDQTFDKGDFSVGVHIIQLLVTLDAGLTEEVTLKDTVVISITSNVPYLFSWSDEENVTGREPWKVNGQETPEIFKDTIAGTESLDPGHYTHFNGKIFFVSNYGWYNHQRLWSIDANGANLTDLNSDVLGGLIVAGDYLYYKTTDNQLAVIDATNTIETFSFDDITYINTIKPVGDKVFIAIVTSSGPELYVINRAVSNSPKLIPTPDAVVNDIFSSLADVNGTLFFNHKSNGTHLSSILKTDGATVETVKTGFRGTRPNNFTAVGGMLYFTAFTSEAGTELWRSDGTETGTNMVQDIFTGVSNDDGPNSSSPYNLINANGTLLFIARSEKTQSGTASKDLQAVYTPTPYERNVWKVLTPNGKAFKTGISIGEHDYEVELYTLGENVFLTSRYFVDGGDEEDEVFSTLWRTSVPFSSKMKIQDFPNQNISINFFVGNSFYFTTEDRTTNKFWIIDDIKPNNQQTIKMLLEKTHSGPYL